MDHFTVTVIFLFVLFLLLGSGVWIGLALMGVAAIGIVLFDKGFVWRKPDRQGVGQRFQLDLDCPASLHLDG